MSDSSITEENKDGHLVGAKEQFEYAWKHFDFLADQRVRTFNFYAILLAASIGGTLTVFERMNNARAMMWCGVWHIGIGMVFFLLDVRARKMIEIPKAALRWFENRPGWISPKHIVLDDEQMKKNVWSRFASYTFAIRATCVAQIIFGIVTIVDAIRSICPAARP